MEEELKSFLNEVIYNIKKVTKDEFKNFILGGIEIDEQTGSPQSVIFHLHAPPMEALGMLTFMEDAIKKEKEKILARLDLMKMIPEIIEKLSILPNITDDTKDELAGFIMHEISSNPNINYDELVKRTSNFLAKKVMSEGNKKPNDTNENSDDSSKFKYDL